jgi:HTH-type transcriptional regulator, sugar sensing transcriptional regulator
MTNEEAIKALGFNEKESRVYLALLETGTGSAVGITHKTGIKRPTVYFILEELEKRGIVFLIPRSKKRLYRAKRPEYLFEEAQEKLKRALEKLPEIEAVSKQESFKPQVFLFDGIDGVKESLNYKMDEMSGEEIKGFFAKTDLEIMKVFDGYKKHNSKLREKKIKIRGLVPFDESLKSFREVDREYGREIREVKKDEYSSDVAVEIGNSFVRFFDPVNLQGLIIENPAITKTMGEIFEMVWKSRA